MIEKRTFFSHPRESHERPPLFGKKMPAGRGLRTSIQNGSDPRATAGSAQSGWLPKNIFRSRRQRICDTASRIGRGSRLPNVRFTHGWGVATHKLSSRCKSVYGGNSVVNNSAITSIP